MSTTACVNRSGFFAAATLAAILVTIPEHVRGAPLQVPPGDVAAQRSIDDAKDHLTQASFHTSEDTACIDTVSIQLSFAIADLVTAQTQADTPELEDRARLLEIAVGTIAEAVTAIGANATDIAGQVAASAAQVLGDSEAAGESTQVTSQVSGFVESIERIVDAIRGGSLAIALRRLVKLIKHLQQRIDVAQSRFDRTGNQAASDLASRLEDLLALVEVLEQRLREIVNDELDVLGTEMARLGGDC